MAKPKLLVEHADIAWKQVIEHVNEFPSNLSGIDKVQTVIATYYDKTLPKTNDINEFLKRKCRYEFNVFLKIKQYRYPAHHFIFDKKEDAEKAREYCLNTMINELIEPYRQIVKSGKKLTKKQIEECEKIQNLK